MTRCYLLVVYDVESPCTCLQEGSCYFYYIFCNKNGLVLSMHFISFIQIQSFVRNRNQPCWKWLCSDGHDVTTIGLSDLLMRCHVWVKWCLILVSHYLSCIERSTRKHDTSETVINNVNAFSLTSNELRSISSIELMSDMCSGERNWAVQKLAGMIFTWF